MQKTPKPLKDRRLLFIVMFCAISGAILNGSAGWSKSVQCFDSQGPAQACLQKPPVIGAIEGGLMGVFAGAGAAIAATWGRHSD